MAVVGILEKEISRFSWILRRRISHAVSDNNNCIRPFESIPTAKGLPLIGTLWDIYKAGGVSQIHRYIDKRHRQLGPIFREKLGHVEAVWVCDTSFYRQVYQNEGKYPQPMLPEPWLLFNRKHGCQRGLFFMQGEEWATYRKILGPLMLKLTTIQKHFESLNLVADQLVDNWKQTPTQVPDLEQDLYTYFVQGLMCMAFGREIGLDKDVWGIQISEMVVQLQGLFEHTARLTLIPPSLAAKLNLNVWTQFETSAMNSLRLARNLTDVCMERLDKNLQACDGSIVASLKRMKVPHHDIQRIVTDLFLAAADTTSHTMLWVLYSLAQHEASQSLVAEECEQKMTQMGDQWQEMPLMKGSIKEALRLYPVAPFLTRILPESCTISNYHIPAETLVLLSTYSSGRSEQYFNNPNKFLPDRWTRSGPSIQDPYASLPFGHGKRSCVGRRLAETQMYILIGKILPEFKLKAEGDVDMIMRLLGTVDKPVRLRLEPRK